MLKERNRGPDFEDAVAEAHNALVRAGHSWAQPRKISISEMHDSEKLPHEWISAPAEKAKSEQRLVTVYPRPRQILIRTYRRGRFESDWVDNGSF